MLTLSINKETAYKRCNRAKFIIGRTKMCTKLFNLHIRVNALKKGTTL